MYIVDDEEELMKEPYLWPYLYEERFVVSIQAVICFVYKRFLYLSFYLNKAVRLYSNTSELV